MKYLHVTAGCMTLTDLSIYLGIIASHFPINDEHSGW